MTVAGFVVRSLDRSRTVEVNPWQRSVAAGGDQPERHRWRVRRTSLEGIIQRCSDKGAYTDPLRGGLTPHLSCEAVFQRDRNSHLCTAYPMFITS